MKQRLLTTYLGHVALTLRDTIGLLKCAVAQPEAVGMMANDILSTKLITKICAADKVFIDIGAHIGSIISEVQRSDASITVIGIEAIPEKVLYLKKHFPKATFFDCALGDTTDTVSFYVNQKASGYSSLTAPDSSTTHQIKEISVPLRRLDDLDNFNGVDAIKIDVEGTELEVIKGAQETIENNKPIIMFESGPGHTQSKQALWELLQSLGYSVHLQSFPI